MAALAGELINVHGEQDRSIDQQVPLGKSDVAPVSPVAEDRAGALEGCRHRPPGHWRPVSQSRQPSLAVACRRWRTVRHVLARPATAWRRSRSAAEA